MIWSYPRGEDISKDGETAIDVGAYAAQIAALLGAHIIKIKLSTDHLEQGEAKKVYEKHKIDVSTQAARVRHCMQAAFGGRRIVVFSGGAAKGEDAVYDDARAIRDGGGNGSIIGRNTFQRSRADALAMLDKLVEIYKGAGLKRRRNRRHKGDSLSPLGSGMLGREAETGITSSNVSRSRAAPWHRRCGLRHHRGGADGLPQLRRAPGRARAAQPLPRRGAGDAPAERARRRCRRSARRSPTRPQRLSTEHLDLDLLDEQARKVLGLGRPDEIIIR